MPVGEAVAGEVEAGNGAGRVDTGRYSGLMGRFIAGSCGAAMTRARAARAWWWWWCGGLVVGAERRSAGGVGRVVEGIMVAGGVGGRPHGASGVRAGATGADVGRGGDGGRRGSRTAGEGARVWTVT